METAKTLGSYLLVFFERLGFILWYGHCPFNWVCHTIQKQDSLPRIIADSALIINLFFFDILKRIFNNLKYSDKNFQLSYLLLTMWPSPKSREIFFIWHGHYLIFFAVKTSLRQRRSTFSLISSTSGAWSFILLRKMRSSSSTPARTWSWTHRPDRGSRLLLLLFTSSRWPRAGDRSTPAQSKLWPTKNS